MANFSTERNRILTDIVNNPTSEIRGDQLQGILTDTLDRAGKTQNFDQSRRYEEGEACTFKEGDTTDLYIANKIIPIGSVFDVLDWYKITNDDNRTLAPVIIAPGTATAGASTLSVVNYVTDRVQIEANARSLRDSQLTTLITDNNLDAVERDTNESEARTDGDSTLDQRITTEVNTLEQSIASNRSQVDNANALTNSVLGARITNEIQAEANARSSKDSEQDGRLDDLDQLVGDNQTGLNSRVTTNEASINALETRDSSLQSSINSVSSAIPFADNGSTIRAKSARDLDLRNQNISNVADPTSDNDATNRQWVIERIAADFAVSASGLQGIADIDTPPSSPVNGTWYFGSGEGSYSAYGLGTLTGGLVVIRRVNGSWLGGTSQVGISEFNNDIDANSNKITSLGSAEDETDAANLRDVKVAQLRERFNNSSGISFQGTSDITTVLGELDSLSDFTISFDMFGKNDGASGYTFINVGGVSTILTLPSFTGNAFSINGTATANGVASALILDNELSDGYNQITFSKTGNLISAYVNGKFLRAPNNALASFPSGSFSFRTLPNGDGTSRFSNIQILNKALTQDEVLDYALGNFDDNEKEVDSNGIDFGSPETEVENGNFVFNHTASTGNEFVNIRRTAQSVLLRNNIGERYRIQFNYSLNKIVESGLLIFQPIEGQSPDQIVLTDISGQGSFEFVVGSEGTKNTYFLFSQVNEDITLTVTGLTITRVGQTVNYPSHTLTEDNWVGLVNGEDRFISTNDLNVIQPFDTLASRQWIEDTNGENARKLELISDSFNGTAKLKPITSATLNRGFSIDNYFNHTFISLYEHRIPSNSNIDVMYTTLNISNEIGFYAGVRPSGEFILAINDGTRHDLSISTTDSDLSGNLGLLALIFGDDNAILYFNGIEIGKITGLNNVDLLSESPILSKNNNPTTFNFGSIFAFNRALDQEEILDVALGRVDENEKGTNGEVLIKEFTDLSGWISTIPGDGVVEVVNDRLHIVADSGNAVVALTNNNFLTSGAGAYEIRLLDYETVAGTGAITYNDQNLVLRQLPIPSSGILTINTAGGYIQIKRNAAVDEFFIGSIQATQIGQIVNFPSNQLGHSSWEGVVNGEQSFIDVTALGVIGNIKAEKAQRNITQTSTITNGQRKGYRYEAITVTNNTTSDANFKVQENSTGSFVIGDGSTFETIPANQSISYVPMKHQLFDVHRDIDLILENDSDVEFIVELKKVK